MCECVDFVSGWLVGVGGWMSGCLGVLIGVWVDGG